MASSYVTVGSGDHHVLAIHGWFGSARGWGSLPWFLDGSAYTWVFMNLRGYGDRRDTAGEFTADEVAADARDGRPLPRRCCRERRTLRWSSGAATALSPSLLRCVLPRP